LLQEGARKLLQAAIENEIIEYIEFHKDRRDENGQRLVVRNGHLPEREIISGIGPIKVRQPRVRHRDTGRFSSAILPPFMRRTPSVDAFSLHPLELVFADVLPKLFGQFGPGEWVFADQDLCACLCHEGNSITRSRILGLSNTWQFCHACSLTS
jgi:hypothetical protein